MNHEEMRLKYEAIRDENTNLKRVQNVQGNELLKRTDGKKELQIDQLMNDLRFQKETVFKLKL